eukprot:6205955-Pleurochrysis_carterae.AAC.1
MRACVRACVYACVRACVCKRRGGALASRLLRQADGPVGQRRPRRQVADEGVRAKLVHLLLLGLFGLRRN